MEYFQNLPFCGACMVQIITEYGKRADQHKREEWKLYYAQQLLTWKERATTALGVSSAVGAMIGGATAVVAGSAVGLARGAVAAAAATANVRGRSRDPSPKAIEDVQTSRALPSLPAPLESVRSSRRILRHEYTSILRCARGIQ